jgi:hypothetical protein
VGQSQRGYLLSSCGINTALDVRSEIFGFRAVIEAGPGAYHCIKTSAPSGRGSTAAPAEAKNGHSCQFLKAVSLSEITSKTVDCNALLIFLVNGIAYENGPPDDRKRT